MKLPLKRKYQRKTVLLLVIPTVLLLVIPVVITHSTTCTHTHTPQSFTNHAHGGRFRVTLGKTLGGIGPVQTTAGRAAADTTLVPKQRIQLLPVPTEALTIRCLVKKRYVPIESDYQEPQLRQAENVLIAYATGDMLRRSNKYGMANEAYAEGAALLAKLENIEFFQQAQRQQLVPEVDEAYGADNRLYGKGYW